MADGCGYSDGACPACSMRHFCDNGRIDRGSHGIGMDIFSRISAFKYCFCYILSEKRLEKDCKLGYTALGLYRSGTEHGIHQCGACRT